MYIYYIYRSICYQALIYWYCINTAKFVEEISLQQYLIRLTGVISKTWFQNDISWWAHISTHMCYSYLHMYMSHTSPASIVYVTHFVSTGKSASVLDSPGAIELNLFPNIVINVVMCRTHTHVHTQWIYEIRLSVFALLLFLSLTLAGYCIAW